MLHLSLCLSLAISSSLAAPAPCPSRPAAAQDELFGEVAEGLRQNISRGQFRGVVALVEVQGELLMQEVSGIQNASAQTPMALDTIFRIYSMSKPVTVVAALMLMEEGRFDLDDAVSKHLPEFKALSVGVDKAPLEREMTVRDLMRHTSGLAYGIFANSAVDLQVRAADVLNPDSSLSEMVTKLASLPLKHQPGRTFEYSLSIDVLGRLVEVWSGKSLAAFMQERIFAPLGMADTGFYVESAKEPRMADMNTRSKGELQIIPPASGTNKLPGLQSGGGGLYSSAPDYLRFAQMLLNSGTLDGKRLLSKSSVAEMTANQMTSIGNGGSFGLGGAVVSRTSDSGPGLRSYSWGGLAGTDFWIDPSEGIIAIFMVQNMGENQHSAIFKHAVYEAIGR